MAIGKRGKQVLVIDFGSYSIKFIVTSTVGDVLTVHNAFSIPVPEASYSNGVILDPKSIVSVIKEALSVNSVSAKDVIVTFNSTELITRNWTVPKLSSEDMLGIIKYEISQYLPIQIDDYDIVYKVVDTVVEDGVDKYNIDSYIVKKELVSGFYDVLKECGLTPIVLDVHSNAISKLAKHVEIDGVSSVSVEGEEITRVFIDIGYNNVLIDVFNGEKNVLTRVINKGFFGLDTMISEKLNISLTEAEDLRIQKFSGGLNQLVELYEKIKFIDFQQEEIDKYDCGLASTRKIMSEQEKSLFDSLKETVGYFYEMASEINKVLGYYLSRNTSNKIDIIYYYGSSMVNENMFEFFSDNVEFESRTLQLDKLKSVSNKQDVELSISYANAVGAAFRRKGD